MLNQSNANSIIKGALKVSPNEWFYVTSAEFYPKDMKNVPLEWESTNPNILQINPNSGLAYAKKAGTETIYATHVGENEPIVFCTVTIEVNVQGNSFVKAHSMPSGNSIVSPTCSGDSDSSDITALGYSGTVFSFTRVGRRITLEKGLGAKNGTYDTYASLFRYELGTMKRIYASLSSIQKEAWMALRVTNFMQTVINLLSGVDSATRTLAESILAKKGIDLGDRIDATLIGLYEWYQAEQSAVSYFDLF